MPVEAAATVQSWKDKREKYSKTYDKSKRTGFVNFKKEKKQLKRRNETNELDFLKKQIESLETEKARNNFSDFPLSLGLQNALTSIKFKTPTTIQKRTLPYTLKGDNVIAAAKTGSGKTLAFAIPE